MAAPLRRNIGKSSARRSSKEMKTSRPRAKALRRRLRSTVDSSEVIPRRPLPRRGRMAGYVVDASVAVKWLVAERFSNQAGRPISRCADEIAKQSISRQVARSTKMVRQRLAAPPELSLGSDSRQCGFGG